MSSMLIYVATKDGLAAPDGYMRLFVCACVRSDWAVSGLLEDLCSTESVCQQPPDMAPSVSIMAACKHFDTGRPLAVSCG